jgi:hypothetical protein
LSGDRSIRGLLDETRSTRLKIEASFPLGRGIQINFIFVQKPKPIIFAPMANQFLPQWQTKFMPQWLEFSKLVVAPLC